MLLAIVDLDECLVETILPGVSYSLLREFEVRSPGFDRLVKDNHRVDCRDDLQGSRMSARSCIEQRGSGSDVFAGRLEDVEVLQGEDRIPGLDPGVVAELGEELDALPGDATGAAVDKPVTAIRNAEDTATTVRRREGSVTGVDGFEC